MPLMLIVILVIVMNVGADVGRGCGWVYTLVLIWISQLEDLWMEALWPVCFELDKADM